MLTDSSRQRAPDHQFLPARPAVVQAKPGQITMVQLKNRRIVRTAILAVIEHVGGMNDGEQEKMPSPESDGA